MATPTSGQQAAQQNGTAKTSGGKKRHVASQAGVTRYGKPIGSEIGGPRDANHAAIQQDQGARKNYGDLIGGDAAKQRAALDGMSTDDLNKLADISFSFKSSDPKVVALRIAARNAQARRGIRIKPGQTQTNPGAKPQPSVNYNNRGATKALSRGVGPASQRLIELAAATEQKNTSKLGSFPIPDVNHLRKAISAIGRAKPEHRPVIARHIIARASKLNASHLVSDHIKHYARGHREPGTVGMARGGSGDAVELAGRWKHGYIPLDAVAMQSKMKGGKGKPWWEGGHGHSVGGSAKKAKPSGSPKSGSPKANPLGPRHEDVQALRKFTDQYNAREKVLKPGKAAKKRKADAILQRFRNGEISFEEKNRLIDEAMPNEGSLSDRDWVKEAKNMGASQKLTGMVKSGSDKPNPRGAKVNESTETAAQKYQRLKSEGKSHAQAMDILNGGRGEKRNMAADRIDNAARKGNLGSGTGGQGRQRSTTRSDHTAKELQTASPARAAELKRRQERDAAPAPKPTNRKTPASSTRTPSLASAKTKRAEGDKGMDSPGLLARNYIAMHGADAANRQADKLEAKANPSSRDRDIAGALRAYAKNASSNDRMAKLHAATAGKNTPAAGPVDRVAKLHRETAPKPAAAPVEKTAGLNIATGKTETRAVVRNHKGEVIGTNKTGAAKSAQTRALNKSMGAFSPANQKSSSGTATATPQSIQNGKRYIQMHGTAGAQKKVAQLEARGHLTAPERVQLAGLKAALAGKA